MKVMLPVFEGASVSIQPQATMATRVEHLVVVVVVKEFGQGS
jgi:hypothetical protein